MEKSLKVSIFPSFAINTETGGLAWALHYSWNGAIHLRGFLFNIRVPNVIYSLVSDARTTAIKFLLARVTISRIK